MTYEGSENIYFWDSKKAFIKSFIYLVGYFYLLTIKNKQHTLKFGK